MDSEITLPVSVIITVYNIKKYIKECIDSVISQTYKNWELIIIDDGSTDGSEKICDTYANSDSRIRVIHKENGGVSSARKTGVENMNGKYGMIVDGDDWISPETLEECVNIVNNYNPECVFFTYIREYSGKSIPVHIYNKSINFTDNNIREVYRRFWGLYENELRHPEKGDSIASCCYKLYSSDVLKRAAFIDRDAIGASEDTLFNIYALRDCRKIYYLDLPLYHYRKQTDTSFSENYRPGLQDKYKKLYLMLDEAKEKNKIDEDCITAYNNRIALSIIGIGLNELEGPIVKDRIKNIRKYIKSERYKSGYRNMQFKYLPMIWKWFIFCAGHGMAVNLYIMLSVIKHLKSRI